MENYDGQTLKQALKSAERSLEERIDEINALNVFPVPDGDTGINMFLTMQSATAAVEDLSTTSAAEISAKAARGALMGARGNSGVILSQILRGLAKGMEMKDCFSAADFAQALCRASDTAYRSISQPVEGTIITVMREASEAAVRQAAKGATLRDTMSAIVSQARRTVKKTPEMLPRLKEAGVVDAGGKGLSCIFEGMKRVIATSAPERESRARPVSQTTGAATPGTYGFDLQFLVEGDCLPIENIREKMLQMGDSVLVVGDEKLIRVHIHTHDPQAVLDYCACKGSLKDVAQENMDVQAAAFSAPTGATSGTRPAAGRRSTRVRSRPGLRQANQSAA